MKAKQWILLFICLFSWTMARAQDIHFSQIDINPILFNPAYSGFFDGTGRFGLSYRNQWASVSKAFQTVAATAEVSLMRRRYYRDGLSLGMMLYSDHAGTLHYGTTAGSIILSYFKAVGRNNDNFISVAFETSMGQAGFNTSDILLEDPTENLNDKTTTFMTFGAGIAWFYQPDDDRCIKVGIAGRNLNEPNISYLEQEDGFIYRKITAYSRAEYRAWSNFAILPLVAMLWQNNYTEFMVGSDAKWYISESNMQRFNMSAGLYYRWRDAALVQIAAEYNAFTAAISYDANLSKLTPASHTVGSVELTLLYRLSPSKRPSRRSLPCPII